MSCYGYLRSSSLEPRNRVRQGFRLLIRGEVTAGQPFDFEPQSAQPFLREVDLAMLKGIFVTSSDFRQSEQLADPTTD